MKFFTIIAFVCIVLHGSAQAETVMGWGNDGDLTLTEAEIKEVSSLPIFSKRLGRVKLDLHGWKFIYGDFSDPMGYGKKHVENRINNDYLTFLKKHLHESGVFPGTVQDRVSLNAVLLDIKHVSSIGASAESKNLVTSGAILTTKIALRYELIDQEQVVGSWVVSTLARSNGVNPGTRLADSTDIALKRNVRSLLLRIIADFSPENSIRANQALAAIGSEVDSTRTVVGYMLMGIGKTVNTTAGVVAEAVTFAAQNSGAIADGLNSTATQIDRSNREYKQAYTQATLGSRLQTGSTSATAEKPTDNTSRVPEKNSTAASGGSQNTSNKGSEPSYSQQRFTGKITTACNVSCDDALRIAKEWVSQRNSPSMITSSDIIQCDEALGGNTAQKRCLLEVKYKY